MHFKNSLLLLTLAAFLSSCSGASIFPNIGSSMSNPLTLAIDSTNSRLYVNNSNIRVLYNNGSIHVVNITDPTTPTLVDYADTLSFSGQMYLDTTTKLLYTPNRYSVNDSVTVDNLIDFNVDEASADPLVQTDYASGNNPYGIACCDSRNRIFVASIGGTLDYYDPAVANMDHNSLSLTSVLDSGYTFSGSGATRLAIVGDRAVVTNANGGLWIVNLDQLGVAGAYPVDYLIADVASPRGIASDGTYIYVADVEQADTIVPSIYVLNIAPLTPRTGNTTTQVVDKDDDGLVVKNIVLGHNDPQEVVVNSSSTYAFVTDYTASIVSVADIVGGTEIAELTVGTGPYGMAIRYDLLNNPTHLFVANSDSNTVSAIDITTPASPAIVGTYP